MYLENEFYNRTVFTQAAHSFLFLFIFFMLVYRKISYQIFTNFASG